MPTGRRARAGDRFERQFVRNLARACGLQVPDDDLDGLITALRAHMASVAPLRDTDLSGIEPAAVFRATWDE
jgi:hypothetical protein